MIKIAFIGQKGIGGRAQTTDSNITELATQMVREGNTVISYLRKWRASRSESKFNGMILKQIPSLPFRYLDSISYAFLATIHAILVSRPDVVHFYGAGPSLFAWLIRLVKPQTVVVCTLSTVEQNKKGWGSLARFMMRLGEKVSIQYAHATIATSKVVSNYAAVEYGTRAQYVPHGLAVKRVVVDGVILSSFDLQSFNYILVPSNLRKDGGIDLMLSAWQKMCAIRPELFKQIKLVVVGGGMKPSAQLLKLKAQHRGDESIVFTGFQRGEVLDALYAGSRFVVNPGIDSEYAEDVLMAMSFGKAVLAPDTALHRMVMLEYGEVYATGEVLDLMKRIIELFEDPMHTAAIGHAARLFVENERNWEDVTCQVLDLYKESLALREGVFAIR